MAYLILVYEVGDEVILTKKPLADIAELREEAEDIRAQYGENKDVISFNHAADFLAGLEVGAKLSISEMTDPENPDSASVLEPNGGSVYIDAHNISPLNLQDLLGKR